MNCSHTKGVTFYQMYWYRQLPGEGIKQIVFTTTTPPHKYESGFSEDKFPATKSDPQTGSLTVEKLLPEDSGVYFCAVSQHSDSGLTDGSGVTQTDILWEKQGDNATMSCSHTKGAGYNWMYWYRQLPGETMKLIVYTTLGITDHDFGEFKGDKFTATKPDGQSDGSDVTQTPLLWRDEGQSATMNCSHTKDSSYWQMYWYRQLPGEGMKEIVFTTTIPPHKYESGFSEDKFPATKSDPQTGSLTVEKLLPEDSGVYFCAVSQHSDSGRSLSIEVHQSPSSILESPDVSATISCNHSDSTYDVILWYQQPKGSSDLKLIGFIQYTNPTLEDQFNQNFKVTGDGSVKSQLQVLKLRQPEDSGVYYCAASRHSHSLSIEVHQSPSSILESPDVSATISCNHSVSSYYVILWYQQPKGSSGLKLIGFIQYTNPTLEDQFNQNFKVTGDGSVKSQLQVLKLRQPEDSGVYYCAASRHSRSLSIEVHQSPSSILESPDVSATISCNHSDSSFYLMLWYQQPKGSSDLKLIGFIQYTNPTLEDQFNQNFKVTGDGSVKSQLQVLKLRQPEDSGVYYCAASRHSRTLSIEVHQSPSSILESPDVSATISCNHSDSSYDRMLWYQQPKGSSDLKLIGFILYTNPTLEDQFNQNFKVTGDGSVKSQLQVLKLRQPEDSGVYYCAASRHSRSLSIEVHQSPSSILESPDVSATISCNHSVSSYYVILWYQQPKGSSDLKLIGFIQYTNPTLEDQFNQNFKVTGDGSVKSQLQVLKLRQPEDSGVYYCAASRHSCSLSIEVHQSPSSILESPDVSATISCNHSVSTYNVILWYQQPKGSSDLKLIGFILYTNPTLEDQFNQNFKVTGDGSVKSQLQVLKLRQPEDSGVYYCAASRHSRSLSIEVHQSPSSILESPDVSATISCNHSDSSYNVILWYQQPKGSSDLKLIGFILYTNPTLEDQFNQNFKVTGDGSVKSQLQVLKLRQPEDSGVYYCAASRHSCSLSIEVHQSPSSILESPDVSATISCNHSVSSYYVILWYQQPKGSSDLKLIGFIQNTNPTLEDQFNQNFKVTGDGSVKSQLQVLKLRQPEDSGVYYCAASRHSRSLSIEVHQSPSSILESPDVSATISCNHSDSSYDRMLWYQQPKGSSDLKLIGFIQYTNPTLEDQFNQNFKVTGDGSVKSQLQVLKLRQPEDSGVYYCAASRHSRSLSIEVHQSPSSILESPDVSATISCNHSVSTYNVILWYQQPKGSSDLKLIGFIQYTNPTLEDQFNQNFKVTGDGSAKSQLQVLKLRQPEDSGVYYCAASRHTLVTHHYCFHLRIMIMIGLLLHLAALPFCLTELSKNTVYQTPTALIKHPGEEALMNCSHSNTDFDMIQWYKQSAGKNDMVLVGYVRFSSPAVEAQFKDTCNVPLSVTKSSKLQLTFTVCQDNQPKSTVVTPFQTITESSGSSLSNKVQQTPTDMYAETGKTADISCSHNVQDYNRILWYKHSKNKQMQLLGYMNVGSKVYQTPADIYSEPEETAKINCSHSDQSYNQILCNELQPQKKNAGHTEMYWYRQRPGETMTRIVYTVWGGQPDYGGDPQTKYAAIKDNINIGALTVKDLQPDDSGVYFCAVSKHSDVKRSSLSNKVQQTPTDMYAETGKTADISCSHNVQDYNRILWYKHSKNKQMQLLGYMYVGSKVYQTPADIYSEPEETAKINCSHSVQNYDQILWYKQTKNSQLQLLGYMYGGSSLSNKVQQTPTEMYAETGKTADISCSHNVQGYNRILWYKQSKNKQMQLLGYMYVGSKVYQTPADIYSEPEETAKINCSHSVQNYDQILWYKQTKNSQLQLLGYMYVGSSLSNKVQQTPTEMYAETGKTADISCSHNVQDYNQILWYKQSKNKQMQLLGYMNVNTGYPEAGLSVKIDGGADKGQNCTLTTEELSLNSSAVYFCAASSKVYQTPADIYSEPEETAKINCSHSDQNYDQILWYKQTKNSQLQLLGYMYAGHCQDVIQDPKISWSFASQTAEMNCSHNKDISHTEMYWYRQRPGETMTRIVYTVWGGQPDYGGVPQTKYAAIKDNVESGALTVKDLQPDDSGVYFCAVSKHSDVKRVCLGLDVRQSPSDLITKPGDKVQMFCSHDKTDYRMMLWYHRSPGDTAMKLIGYLNYQADTMEEPYRKHFNISGNLGGDGVKNGSLTIQITGPEHSAVYYCAASKAQ
ncbi:hypothetical protein ABVT39_013510 [Epinephelus coioides]